MYGYANNKTHGRIEDHKRIDSFEAALCDSGWGGCLSTGSFMVLDCKRYFECDCQRPQEHGEEEIEMALVSRRDTGWYQEIQLDRIRNGFGGSRAYWLCPHCRGRYRYLYLAGERFICRKCAKLNYRCQQETRHSTNHMRKGLALAKKHLCWKPERSVYPDAFPYLLPTKPKGMHWSTYERHLSRFKDYQKKYESDSWRELGSLIGLYKRFTERKET